MLQAFIGIVDVLALFTYRIGWPVQNRSLNQRPMVDHGGAQGVSYSSFIQFIENEKTLLRQVA